MPQLRTNRRLSNHERGFQDLDTPERLQIVSGVIFLSSEVSSDALWERIEKFVEANPIFRCRITKRRKPEWQIDGSFDLTNHCDEISLHGAEIDQTLSFVSNAASRGFDDNQPPWRISLFHFHQNARKTESCAIAICAHHSLLDGLQGMKLLASLLDETIDSSNCRNSSRTSHAVTQKTETRIRRANCIRAIATEILQPLPSNQFASDIGASTKRATLAFEWSRQAIQATRRKIDASFQEVVLAVITDGLARYSQSRDLKRNLRAILPLAQSENHPASSITNRHDIGCIELPTASAYSCRGAEIRSHLKSRQNQQTQGVFASILRSMERLPNTIRKALAHRYARRADLLISLIPGIRSDSTLSGAKVTSLYAMPALPPSQAVAIGVTINRHNVGVTVQIDPECIICPRDLKSCFEKAYRKICPV